MANDIFIKNARMHNLRGIDVTIPRNSLTVVTGLSGSGKSTLAFDTLYAEGQRRYVESLSAYARQFLDRLEKPDVEKIEGLSPAISIEQHTTSGNPRSIVATVTEIHDYLRILWGSAATAHCPHCGKPVTRQSAEQIVDSVLKRPGRAILLAPVVKGKKGSQQDVFAALKRAGFSRVKVDGETHLLEEVPALDKKKAHNVDVVVDRLVIPVDANFCSRQGKDDDSSTGRDRKIASTGRGEDAASTFRTRLTDSVELALKTGKGVMKVEWLGEGGRQEARDARVGEGEGVRRETGDASAQSNNQTIKQSNNETVFSELNACVDCGVSFDELKPRSFSFNSPFGACPTCAGLGQLYYFDEDLVVPDKTLPLEEAIHPWRRIGGQMAILYHKELLAQIARQNKVKLSTPYEKLPAAFRRGLMHGFKEDLVLSWRRVDRPFEGILANLKAKMEDAPDDETRAKYEAYQNFRVCPDCHGARLNAFSRAATVAGKTLVEVMAMPVREASAFFEAIEKGVRQETRDARSGEGEGVRHEARDARSGEGVRQETRDARSGEGEGVRHETRDASGDKRQKTRDVSRLTSDSSCLMSHASCPTPGSCLTSHASCPTPNPFAGLHDILGEITRRLRFLVDVGLDYLTLDRAAATLSGGEMQRIRLATQIGSGLTGVLYVLDEPTIGLHPRDNERLIATLKGLRDRGNTVVVVEHDAEMMKAADYIVDLGPGAGREGGQVMYQGDYRGLLKAKSLTADYLTGRKTVGQGESEGVRRETRDARVGDAEGVRHETRDARSCEGEGVRHETRDARSCEGEGMRHETRDASGDKRQKTRDVSRLASDSSCLMSHASCPTPGSCLTSRVSRPTLTLSGCCEHNLKNVTAHFPVGAFTVVTGVSGSGKSTLVDDTLKRALMQKFYNAKARPGKFKKLTGADSFDKVIEIDQSPIGRTPRSNPATYVGFFSEIRELFAKTAAAKARGYTAGRFSFNVKGGRCEVCGGDGLRKLEMSFLPDVYVTCEQCGGKRFNAETLEVTYGGKSIADVLEMTVAEACEFFAKVPSLARKLQTLNEVGLGYVALGQSATTLSGGEAQRIKLATELSRRSTGRTLYLLDEPTTGLHFDDVAKLMKILLRLRDQGNTVIVIEHNLDVIRLADWIVDLGPDGGDAGGHLVCEGPVAAVRACRESVTGKFI